MLNKEQKYCGFCGNSLGTEIYTKEYVDSLIDHISLLKGRISSDVVTMITNIRNDMLTINQLNQIKSLCETQINK